MDQSELEKIFIDSFTAYGDAIFRFCMVKVSGVELAEDFTQEVFTRYWQALREGKEMTNTRAYLYTIANNMAKDWYRKKKADSLDARLDRGLEPRDTSLGTIEQAAYQEALSMIQTMDEADKELLLLRYVEGLEPREIAEIYGKTPNTISVRLNRAMGALRERLHASPPYGIK